MWSLLHRCSQLCSSNSLPSLTIWRRLSTLDSKQLLKYPSLKKLDNTELPVYASLKQRNPAKALELFSKLKDEKFKFSSPILTIGFKLLLYYEQPMSWYELRAYLLEVGIFPESGLTGLILENAISDNSTEMVLDILETCLAKGYALRANSFTNSIEHLLRKIKDYQMIGNILDTYMEKKYRIHDAILNCLCDLITSDPSNQILIDLLKKCLKYYHKMEFPVRDSDVFQNLSETLSTLAKSETPIKLAPLVDGACGICGQSIRKVELTEEEYETLKTKLHEIIQEQYDKFQRTKGMKVDIENFQSTFSSFSESLQADNSNSQGIIIDGMNASFLVNSHRCSRLITFSEILRKEYPNSQLFIVFRRYMLNNTPQSQKEKLQELATVSTTQSDSRDDLFTIYGTLRLKERGLLITNDKFSELRNDLPLSLHPLLNKWYTKHIVHFNLVMKCFPQDQLIHAVQYNEDGSLHIPLHSTHNWICTRLD